MSLRPDLAPLVQTMLQTHDADISMYEESFLSRIVTSRQNKTGLSAATYPNALAADAREATALLSALNISYSSFFRDTLTFAALEHIVLPRLLDLAIRSGRPELRIWSAACAAGQETYSVAILMDELLAARTRSPRVRIFGTDHCAANLETAIRGIYDQEAVRNVRLRHLAPYFAVHDGQYEILPRIRAQVLFSQHSLLDIRASCPQASIYGDFDLVVCGNMLFYYRPDIRAMILRKLRASLAPHGYLATGETEQDIVVQSGMFRPLNLPGAIFLPT